MHQHDTGVCTDDCAQRRRKRKVLDGSICEEIPPNPKKLIQKVSQWNLVLFFMLFNILKVYFILTIRKGSFSRWRPRWLPRAKILYIQGNIHHRKMFLVSNPRL